MYYLRSFILYVLFTGVTGFFCQATAQAPSDSLLLQRLDSLKQQPQADTSLIQTYFNLAHHYLRQDSAKTGFYANRALQVADSIDSQLGRGIGNMALGLHHIIQGNYTRGLKNAFEAEVFFQDLNRDDYLAMLYSYIGIGYSRVGNNNEALRYYLRSDSLMKKTGSPMQQAQIKANIGIIHGSQGHHQSTIRYFKDAMVIIEQFGAPAHLALGYHNIGVAYRHLSEYDSALVYLKRALDLRQNSNDRFGLASSLHNLGKVYIEQEQYEFALSYLDQAIELQQELGDQGNLLDAYLDAGRIYQNLQEPHQAKAFAENSLEIAERIGDLNHQAEAMLFLSNLAEQANDYQAALDYLKTNRLLQDSLADQNQSQAFEEMRARYESQEMEQQIELLQQSQKLQQAELDKARVFRNSLFGGSGALLLILALLFLRYRSGKKHEALLEVKNKQLEELSEEKSEYLHIAAHDLKTPLSSILGLSELIKDTESASEETRKHAEYIYISAFRMLDLIKQFLDVNAIESGRKLAEVRPVDLSSTMEEVVKHYMYRAKWKDLTIKLEQNSDCLPAIADPSIFQEVMENILSNAVKYSPKGKRIWIRNRCLEHTLRIEVKDEGPGLSREDQQQLFQKFKRLSPNPTADEGSTGLGLYIVKKMTDAMEGKIWCESRLGEGCTFIVELPLADEPVS